MNYREKMEKKLGRKLKKNEVVHHIDGDQHNNELSNLVVMTRKEHSKMKKVDWEKKINEALLKREKIDALDLHQKMSVLFTARQQDIIFKRLKREKLSKVEAEMWSRVIKKKVKAIANSSLHEMAQQIVWEM